MNLVNHKAFDDFQEESATVSITEKGRDSEKVDVSWTKDNMQTIDRVSMI